MAKQLPKHDPMDEAEESSFAKAFADINVARAAVIVHCENRLSVAGACACPVCLTGTLHYTRAYNGHVHASCSTESCVRWME